MTVTRKKTTRGRKPLPAEPTVAQYREKKCVRITEADNGFTVSTYGRGGEEIKVANSMGQAIRHVKDMIGATAKK